MLILIPDTYSTHMKAAEQHAISLRLGYVVQTLCVGTARVTSGKVEASSSLHWGAAQSPPAHPLCAVASVFGVALCLVNVGPLCSVGDGVLA